MVLQKRGAAFTLVEVILGSALGLLLLAVFTLTLIPLLRYSSWASTRASLVQAAMLVGERLGGDLQRAPLSGLSLPNAQFPGRVAVHALSGVTDSGVAAWEDSLLLYSWDANEGSLVRAHFTPVGMSLDRPTRLTAAEIGDALAQPTLRRQRLVDGILKEFRLETHGGADPLPLILRLVTELSVAGKPPQRFELVKELNLRNGGSS